MSVELTASSRNHVKLNVMHVGEEGVEAAASETSLDVCPGQSAETGSTRCNHCSLAR